MAIAVRNQHQREILRRRNLLSGKYTRYQVYCDFVIMSALSISCSIDLLNAPARRKQLKDIFSKYSQKEIAIFDEMFAQVVEGLEREPEQDFLGELFMMCEFGNDAGGQFFTPYSVCRAMASISFNDDLEDIIEKKGFAVCGDCACGAGATLIAFANECKRKKINYQQKILFIAQDIDYLTACQCYIQMSLLGMPGYVCVDDSLIHPCTAWDDRSLLPRKPENCFFTPMFFSTIWTGRKVIARIGLWEKSAQGNASDNPGDLTEPIAEPVTEERVESADPPQEKPRAARKKKPKYEMEQLSLF